ncbi:MAG: sensor histidine kinase [Oscillospiraceae bacterium]
MIKRLRKRFIRIAMLSVTVVMLLLALIVNIANYISTDSDLTKTLDMLCENQGTFPLRDYFDADKNENADDIGSAPNQKWDNHRAPFDREAPYSTRYFCLRYDENGSLIHADLNHIAAITEDDVSEFLAVALKHGTGYGYYSNYKYRVIQHGENRFMVVFLDCYQELRAVKIVAVCFLAAIAVCIALVYILVFFFSQKAIDPVVKSVKQQKQFITDAGHELKTPITVIATSLKVLEMETGKQKWIDKAMSQTERLKELVNSLVTLSRMDEEESPLKFEQFSISDTISETAESFVDFAQSMGHELNISVAPDISYCGDEYAVRQLVSILLDNAVKYAAENSPIDFCLEKLKKGVSIRTSNKCEPINPNDLDKLFDRFYRADKSRNTGTGGFGIGLSVARSIAEAHSGSIRAACPTEDMIEFEVILK